MADTIMETAEKAGNFKTLIQAVEKAGLRQALEGEGPYTVFAPSDSAFKKVPDSDLNDLLKPENRSKLRKILRKHVVPGKLPSNKIKSRKYETLGGDMIEVKVSDSTVRFGDAKVTKADIECSNGRIHIIDKVVL